MLARFDTADAVFDSLSAAEDYLAAEKSGVQREADMAASHKDRNRFVINSSDPEHLQYSGSRTLTHIDEQGVPHLYYLTTMPSWNSDAYHADGSVNYYPEGAEAVSVGHVRENLRLLPDGRYELKRKNGTTRLYNLFGQLEEMTDANGNELKFQYDLT